MTVNGLLEFRRRIYWNPQAGSMAPLDMLLGIQGERHSVGVREMACQASLNEAFVPACKTLERLAQISISSSVPRELVEREGRRAEQAVRRGRYGPDWTNADCTDQTRSSSAPVAWREEMMEYVWNQGSLVMLHKLSNYHRRHRSGRKREALESLQQYVAKRVDMTDYPTFRRLGYDCGSGPTESFCGCLTARLKGRGMRWDKDNAESVTALADLYYSNLWTDYWSQQRPA